MNETLAAIDKRIAYAADMRKTRPHEHTQWFVTGKQFETLREEIEQGLHGNDWQRWTRPGIPCHPDAIIEIRTLDGSTDKGKACNFTWSTQCGWATIVEWREISPQT